MRLLICTQAVDRNDPILGFFCRWVEEFAKHCEKVTVVCLREGEHDLPANVRVYSLGKEKSATSKVRYALRFWWLLWRFRRQYDAVFVHMNPEYVALGGAIWRWSGKKVGLWYVHKSVDFKLRAAEKFANMIFTASPESFRLRSKKVRVVGHGIDTQRFNCSKGDSRNSQPATLKLLTVGRIAPSKGIETLFDALEILSVRNVAFSFDLVGATAREGDVSYEDILRARAASLPEGAVHFLGPRRQEEVAELLCEHDLFLNASRGTGSLDKAVLEALASGLPAISTNEAFREILAPYGLFGREGTGAELAGAVESFRGRADRSDVAQKLQEEVRAHHSLQSLIPRILAALEV